MEQWTRESVIRRRGAINTARDVSGVSQHFIAAQNMLKVFNQGDILEIQCYPCNHIGCLI
jgi:hypothetical protein